MTDDIRLRKIEKQHVTLLFLFDFSKVFVSVYHVRLLKKFLDYGLFRLDIRWIASYLLDREQAVIGGIGNCSTYLKVNTEVPQSSVLGPLLFAIYVNDISLCLGYDVSHLMYVDDLQVYIRCPLVDLDHWVQKLSVSRAGLVKTALDQMLAKQK